MPLVDDPAVVTDKRLDTPAIAITSAAAQVTFRNFYFLESTFDGGVLEVSSPNINAGAFTDITNAAVGGNFVTRRLQRDDLDRVHESDRGPDGVERQRGRLHQHCGEPGAERGWANDQAAFPDGIGQQCERDRVESGHGASSGWSVSECDSDAEWNAARQQRQQPRQRRDHRRVHR